MKYSLLLGPALGILSTSALAMTAEEIARKMIQRDDGKSSYAKVMLMSCQFVEKGNKRRCQSGKRSKTLEMVAVDLDKSGDHRKSASFIQEPSSEKGVSFLQEDFPEGKDSQQWIFLPALKKLKRVVSATSDGPKTGTLFGSELSYEDMEKPHLADYTYKLLGEEKEQDRPVWLLESTPTAKRLPKTSYGKARLWVDKESFISLKGENYDKQGNLSKTFYSRKLKSEGGIWRAEMLIVVNHRTARMSMMKNLSYKLNVPVSNDTVSPRLLTDGSYRESLLGKLR